jgi:sulfonate transport system permease protein
MSRSQVAEAPARETEAGAPASLHQYVSGYGYSSAGTEGNLFRGPARGGKPRRRWLIVLAGLALPVLLLVAWLVVSELGLVPAYRLPSPDSVWLVATQGVADGTLGTHIAISTQRVLIGFIVGAIIGLVLGAVVGLSKWGSAFLSPSIGAFRAVPSLAWVPLLVLYVGINEDSKVTLIAIGALFPVYTTVAGALRHVDPQLVELGRAYGLGRFELLRQVQFPAVVPSIVSGLRLALAQAWLFLVAAELIASSMGLGFLLIDSQNNGRVDRMFLTIILLGILGKTSDALIGLLERYLLKRWG